MAVTDVKRYPNGSKSGPIFSNLYAMARWTCTQERAGQGGTLPPFFLNPVSHRREIGGRTCGHTRGRCKEKEGLFLEEEEEENQRSLLLREKEDHSSGSGR